MDKMSKLFDVKTKVKSEDKRIITFTASTEHKDRDNEVIKTDAWDLKNYKKNPVFLWGHDYHRPPIGRGVKVKKTEEGLKMDVEFPTKETYPFADTIYKLYKEGFLNAVSVGFMAKAWKDGDPEKPNEPSRTFTDVELLELSGVTVPSNYNALVSARSAGTIDDGEFVTMKALMEGYSKYAEDEDDPIRIQEMEKAEEKEETEIKKTAEEEEEKGNDGKQLVEEGKECAGQLSTMKTDQELKTNFLQLFGKVDELITKIEKQQKQADSLLEQFNTLVKSYEALGHLKETIVDSPESEKSQSDKGNGETDRESYYKELLGVLKPKEDEGLKELVDVAANLFGKKDEI